MKPRPHNVLTTPGVLLCACLLPAVSAAERLPKTAVPEHYDLTFVPDLAAETFEGHARIRVRLAEPASAITLHAAELTISNARIESSEGELPARLDFNEAVQQVTLTAPRAIAGLVTLDLRFAGTLNDQLRGFYISKTRRRKYAATQLEATDARRAFPCFDEPAFKATFDVTLTIDEGDTAISNGRVISDTPGPDAGKHTVKFATTPRMSTYLVAMAVGDFKCLESNVEGTPVRVCAVPDKVDLGTFGVAAIQHILPYFNRYYGIPYPFEKLDVVALPDFGPGAMENTGAIFYRESFLLVDERRTPASALKYIAFVMAHEVAHQWFGDLVTLAWWDDIWLNEGFANWAAIKAVEGWRGWSFHTDATKETLDAMSVDSLASTRQVRTRVESPMEIEEAFDALTYDKASAVLRMIEHYVGVEAFREGVNLYLREFSYRNATAEDFWRTLARTSGKPADRLMASFIEQPGVPRVRMRHQCASQDTRLELAQTRFLFAPSETERSTPQTWTVPICVERAGDGSNSCELLATAHTAATLPGCSAWVHGNDDGVGYYRVDYDPATVSAMVRGLTELSEVELLSLEGDVWAATRSGAIDVATFMELAQALAQAPADRSPIEALLPHLRFLSDRVVDAASRESWRAWMRQLLAPAVRALGWTPSRGESAEISHRRAAVLEALGVLGNDRDVQEKATAMVIGDLDGASAADPSLMTMAYKVAAFAGDRALHDRIMKAVAGARSPVDYYRRQGSLADFRDPKLIDRTFDYAFSADVRDQDFPALMAKLLMNPEAETLVWEALKERWPLVAKKGNVHQGLLQIVRAIQFCDTASADTLEQFFEMHPAPGAERAVTRVIEGTRLCAATKSAQQGRLAAALKRH